MKQSLLLILIFFATLEGTSQSYTGFDTDNYSGIHGVLYNPANVVDSRYKLDLNLASFSIFEGNNAYSIDLSKLINDDDYDILDETNISLNDDNNVYSNIDILGPSFMFNLAPKHAIGILTRARFFGNLNSINGNLIDDLDNNFDLNRDITGTEDNANLTLNSWAEIGLAYGLQLYENEKHFFKGGITLKYLKGMGGTVASGTNLRLNYDADAIALTPGFTTGSVTVNGVVSYSTSENIDIENEDYEYSSNGPSGIGLDLGFVYEWRPDHDSYFTKNKEGKRISLKYKNKYKIKAGISITDIGPALKYKNTTTEAYNINNATISEEEFLNGDFDEVLDRLAVASTTNETINIGLPTALHMNVDWNAYKKFYMSVNTDLSLKAADKANTNRIVNSISLTPRLETRWFSLYSPIGLRQYGDFTWGAGLRAGPLFVGSGTILSNLISDGSKSFDVYAGLKIPIYQRKPKDKDEDGTPDKEDECPEVPGPKENNGCPWEDTDGDTVLDKDDDCPEEAGEVENKGCPWKDTDGDTILDKDDACPDVAGPTNNNGCPFPDSDSDGVLDKDDLCPEIAGTIVNNGCPEMVEPEVTEEVIKQLNDFAKTILFNYGKSTIKEESFPTLTSIRSILNEYPSARFNIDGHTDSSGSSATNQSLSEKRATAIKDYLVQNGIDSSRLNARGFGEEKPIATNKTSAGRTQNRRVEVTLIKE